MNKIGWAACALSVALPLAMLAETDVCGNEIRNYVEDGVTKTYKFISSGDPRINVGSAAVSAASNARASTSDEAGIALASGGRSRSSTAQDLEGRYFTHLVSGGTALQSDKYPFMILIFR